MSLTKEERNQRIMFDLIKPGASIRSVAKKYGIHPSRVAYIKKREWARFKAAYLSTTSITGQ